MNRLDEGWLARAYLLLASFGALNWVFLVRDMRANAAVAVLQTLFLGLTLLLAVLAARPPALRRVNLLLLVIPLAVSSCYFCILLLAHPHPLTDVAGSVNTAADLFMRGVHPYLHFDPLETFRKNGLDAAQYATRREDGSILALYSYPPGSFLLLAPFRFLTHDIRVVGWLMLLVLVVAGSARTPERYRALVALPLLLVPGFTLLMGGGITEHMVILPLYAAWVLRGTRWQGGFWLGIACLIKQFAWFFVPFYLMLLWRERGIRHALLQAGISGALFVAVSLPFAWDAWYAYAAGIFAPVAEPLPPAGEGLGGLIAAGVLVVPRYVPALLEVVVGVAGLAILARARTNAVVLSVVLPVLPLLFAWRSNLSYFLFAGYFALLISLDALRQPATVAARQPLTPEQHREEPAVAGQVS